MIESVKDIFGCEDSSELATLGCLVAGLVPLTKFAVGSAKFITRNLIWQSGHDGEKLHQRYAKKDTWALVTGGSDGIGLEMCQNLASQGFNIIMCSRNAEKIQEKLVTCRLHNVKTKCL